MRIYEIINPSDPVTLEAEDVAVAQAAVLLLGRGQMGLTDEDGEEVLPLLLFGGYEKWAKDNKFDLTATLDKRATEVADCLESAVCADLSDRKAVLAAVGGHGKEALRRYNDEKRSSLNDICGVAFSLAKAIREKKAKGGK